MQRLVSHTTFKSSWFLRRLWAERGDNSMNPTHNTLPLIWNAGHDGKIQLHNLVHNPVGFAVYKQIFGWMMSCWNGRGDGKVDGSHSQVYTGKLVLLRENQGKVAKDSGVLRKSSFESGLPHPDLRLVYKLHLEGSTGQQNTTTDHKMWIISIMCSASDILKSIIFCICSLLASSIYSSFPWSRATDRLR